MRRFAGEWEVLFVEGIPMRSLARLDPAEARRVLGKLRARVGVRTVAPSLHVLRPLPVPPARRLGRRLQLATLHLQITRARRRLGLGGPAVSWFSVPVVAPLLGRLGDAGSILYYQDRYDAFSHVDGELLRRRLAELARACEVAVATADHLADDLRSLGATPEVIPHGVDLDHFAGEYPAPADVAAFERPLVGYVGLVDDYLDMDAIVAVADRLRSGTVVLVGRANTDVSALRHPRIRLLGSRPYESIPAYLGAFACCLIPFRLNRLTVAVNPIKLREFLAAGRPVVSTPLPEALRYGDVVAVAEGKGPFADAVIASLDARNDEAEARARRRASVEGESWDAVAARIAPLLRRLVEAA